MNTISIALKVIAITIIHPNLFILFSQCISIITLFLSLVKLAILLVLDLLNAVISFCLGVDLGSLLGTK